MRGMAKILCIDDDKYLMDLLSYGLTRAGFEVVTECSGRAGLGALYEGRVDLVILAVNIPDMNGFKILTALRAFSQVPVIMLTACAQDEDVMAGFAGGADDYVAKPFSMQALVTRVKAILRRYAARPVEPPKDRSGRAYWVAGATLDPETNELRATTARGRDAGAADADGESHPAAAAEARGAGTRARAHRSNRYSHGHCPSGTVDIVDAAWTRRR